MKPNRLVTMEFDLLGCCDAKRGRDNATVDLAD